MDGQEKEENVLSYSSAPIFATVSLTLLFLTRWGIQNLHVSKFPFSAGWAVPRKVQDSQIPGRATDPWVRRACLEHAVASPGPTEGHRTRRVGAPACQD